MKEVIKIRRRDFLKISSISGMGLVLGFGISARGEQNESAVFEPNAFLSIGADNRIIIYSKNPEIGQGVKTSMPMIIAEELEVDWNDIEVRQAGYDRRLGAQFAGGSTAIKTNWEALRTAGATAKAVLIAAAAMRWKVNADICVAEKGYIKNTKDGKQLSYGQLAAAASQLEVPEKPPLKDPGQFKLIGTSKKGVDNKKIVMGTAEFGLDSRREGMLVAVIEKCPVYGGKVREFDDTATMQVEGVRHVIKIDPLGPGERVAGVAVVADHTWAAIQGRRALKVTWDHGEGIAESSGNIDQMLKNIPHQATQVV